MLKFNPNGRITLKQAMSLQYFDMQIVEELSPMEPGVRIGFDFEDQNLEMEEIKKLIYKESTSE